MRLQKAAMELHPAPPACQQRELTMDEWAKMLHMLLCLSMDFPNIPHGGFSAVARSMDMHVPTV